MTLTRVPKGGFTLVELMIVVAIISVLAVVSMGAYGKYSRRARSAEVYAFLGEIRAKQEAYRAEYSHYCNTAATCTTFANEDTFFPALQAHEPVAKTVTSGAPATWGTPNIVGSGLGLNPGKTQMYCGYVSVAGFVADWSNAGARGVGIFNSVAPTTPWWYASATCDNDGRSAVNEIYTTGMSTTNVNILNEGS